MPVTPYLLPALLLTLPVMALLTWLGGGYAVQQARVDAGGRAPLHGGCMLAVIAALTFFALTDAAGTAFASLIFAAHAGIRGLRLSWWGLRALASEERRVDWLREAAPARLLPAGLLTLGVAWLSGAGTLAFAGYFPSETHVRGTLRDVAALEIAAGRRAAERGAPRYADPFARDEAGKQAFGPRGVFGVFTAPLEGGPPYRTLEYYRITAEIPPDGRSFTLLAVPSRWPRAPFDRLVTLPSFRADETGRIRAIPCTAGGRPCPPDAPVVTEVDEAAIAEMADSLSRAHLSEAANGLRDLARRAEALDAGHAATTTASQAPTQTAAPEAPATPEPDAGR